MSFLKTYQFTLSPLAIHGQWGALLCILQKGQCLLLKSGIQVDNITKAIRISQAECDDGTRAQDQGSLSRNKFIHTKILLTCNRASCIKIGVRDRFQDWLKAGCGE